MLAREWVVGGGGGGGGGWGAVDEHYVTLGGGGCTVQRYEALQRGGGYKGVCVDAYL